MERLKFPKNRRLTSNEQFRAVLSHNLCAFDSILGLYIAPNQCGHPRLGVSVGRYCGGAVVRNRLKRLIREAFRVRQNDLDPHYDYLVIPSKRVLKGLSRDEAAGKIASLTGKQVGKSLDTLVSAALRKADNRKVSGN